MDIPRSFWIISGLALVWNLLGAAAYLFQVTMSPETLATFPENEQALYANVPAWVTSAFGVAVWGGVIGCILLLLKKKLAIPVLVASLVGAILQNAYYVFGMDLIGTFGLGRIVMPLVVILVGIFLISFARRAAAKGWLS